MEREKKTRRGKRRGAGQEEKKSAKRWRIG